MGTDIKIRLQGHEKFALREGWLNKGLRCVSDNPNIFLEKNSADEFGIGSNMVKSLRYWLKAFGLIEDRSGELTPCGRLIYQYDPYIEDLFTLWLLHSNVAQNSATATTWYMFFNMCEIEDLDKEQITQILIGRLNKYTGNMAFSEKSLRSDVDVLLNMYGKIKEATDPEDKNLSPFAQLDLIKNNYGKYSKTQPDRRKTSEWLVLLELAEKLSDKESISIDEITYGENSISAIYQINSIGINEYLDRLDSMGYIRVNRTAGLDMIYKIAARTREDVIREYYESHR